jgi:hypothetical protein
MSIYTLLRKIHLYTGLAILAFVIMYFITGYVIIHQNWFPNPEPLKTMRIEPLVYTGPKEPVAYAIYLQETFKLWGKVTRQRRLTDGSWEFRYSRPGTAYEVVVAKAGDSVRITTVEENAIETMVGFHRLRGYGSQRLYNMWSLLYDLASFSMIVFAFTGIYLWYKLTKKKLLGWICLAISYGYAAVTGLYCMYAP